MLLAAQATLLAGCNPAGGEHCGVQMISSVPNPENGKNNFSGLKAEVIRLDCSATVDWITSVRLVDTDGKPWGNDDGKVFSYYHGMPTVNISWKDKDHLQIDCKDCAPKNVFLKTVKKDSIEISYTDNEAL
jgi:hypothetical protein